MPTGLFRNVGVLANYLHPAHAAEAIAELSGDARRSVPDRRTQVVPRLARLDGRMTAQIIQAYRDGASTYELAGRFGVRRTVRDLLRRAGFDTAAMGKASSLGDGERRELYLLKKEGLTRRDLAKVLQVSESTVKRVLAMHTDERTPEVDRVRATRNEYGLAPRASPEKPTTSETFE